MIAELVLWYFDCSLEFVFFSAVTLALQLFTRKLCLQISGLTMCNFMWNHFPIKNLLIDSLLTPVVESTYLNRDMCKIESSQKDESRAQSTDFLKAYRNTVLYSVFTCILGSVKDSHIKVTENQFLFCKGGSHRLSFEDRGDPFNSLNIFCLSLKLLLCIYMLQSSQLSVKVWWEQCD